MNPFASCEAALRALVVPWLSARGGRILHEMGLDHGQRRVDVASLSLESLHGVELKSEADTLSRLPAQVAAYSAVLDQCTLAVAERHWRAAAGLVPPWWGVLVAIRRQRLCLVVERETQENPAPDNTVAVRLLWRDEALATLRRAGAARGLAHASRRKLYRALQDRLSGDALRREIRARLLAREDWECARPR